MTGASLGAPQPGTTTSLRRLSPNAARCLNGSSCSTVMRPIPGRHRCMCAVGVVGSSLFTPLRISWLSRAGSYGPARGIRSQPLLHRPPLPRCQPHILPGQPQLPQLPRRAHIVPAARNMWWQTRESMQTSSPDISAASRSAAKTNPVTLPPLSPLVPFGVDLGRHCVGPRPQRRHTVHPRAS